MTEEEKKELFDLVDVIERRQRVLVWVHASILAIVTYLFLHFSYGL